MAYYNQVIIAGDGCTKFLLLNKKDPNKKCQKYDLEKYKYDFEKWCKIAKMTLNDLESNL